MHEATGIDFSLYRETTVYRRIQRRLAVRGLPALGEYARLLSGDPDERVALQRDLLIGVTSFFRDPSSFEALERPVFPVILADRAPTSTIRIWVPGCATGEEASLNRDGTAGVPAGRGHQRARPGLRLRDDRTH